jgi:hypothetical protein
MADVHIVCAAPTEDELEMMRDKMRAFIFPNDPHTEVQIAAFDKACTYQIAHEKTIAAQCGDNAIPQGTQSFQIGDFSMDFDTDAMGGMLTKKTVCPAAYGVLLREGLMYKGVERSY